jgi:hypothetical protein
MVKMNSVRSAHHLILNFDSRPRFTIIGMALCAALLLGWGTGCAARKRTWNDWVSRSDRTSKTPPPVALLPVAESPLLLSPGYNSGEGAHVGYAFNLSMRNPDFPRTYITEIHINLSAPTNGVRIHWTGSLADVAPTGPWRFTPGRGTDGFDCDDVGQSNTTGSRCTPKGVFKVAGFTDHLEETPYCLYGTWVIHEPRFIAIHSHPDLPVFPASSGCIRMSYETAKLIHNNSLAGVTLVSISGTWQRPPPTNQFEYQFRR